MKLGRAGLRREENDSGGRRVAGADGGVGAPAVTFWEGGDLRLIPVGCRGMLRFLWTYLEELSNFDYGATKKGAKGEAEMSIFASQNSR